MIHILLSIFLPQLLFAPIQNGLAHSTGTRVMGEHTNITSLWHKVNGYALEPILFSPSAVVIDAETGSILYAKNPDEKRAIASLTKLMTSYLYLQKTNYDLSKQITLEGEDERSGGKRYMYRGEIATADDLLHLTLIGSDNTAAVALARAGGFLKNFPAESSLILQKMDLKNTSLKEPTGLDADNVSSALEIAKLARNIFKDEHLSPLLGKETYLFSPLNGNAERKVETTNDLLATSLFHVRGGKTGHTPEAGYCLVLKARDQSGKEIIVSILGAPTGEARLHDAKALVWWIFENFE